MNDKELSDAIYELGVLLTDPLTGLIVTTIKQDFWENVWCEIFDELRREDCEKYEKRLDKHDG